MMIANVTVDIDTTFINENDTILVLFTLYMSIITRKINFFY